MAEAFKSSFWNLAQEPYISYTFSLATCHFWAPGGSGAFWSSLGLSGLAVAPKACQGACLSRLGCLLWASLGLSGALGPDWGRGLQILILEPGSGAFRFVYILFSNLPLLGSWRPRCLFGAPWASLGCMGRLGLQPELPGLLSPGPPMGSSWDSLGSIGRLLGTYGSSSSSSSSSSSQGWVGCCVG